MLTLVLALQLTGTATPSPVMPAPVVTSCRVIDLSPSTAVVGGARRLMAVCGKRGAPLGMASRYSTVTNPMTGGVLVVRVRGRKTDVLIASPTSGGVAVDDVTRDLARLAGRFGDLGLGPLAVDATRFAVDGSVGVIAAGGTRWLDLGTFAAHAAKLVSAAVPSGTAAGAPSNTAASTGAR